MLIIIIGSIAVYLTIVGVTARLCQPHVPLCDKGEEWGYAAFWPITIAIWLLYKVVSVPYSLTDKYLKARADHKALPRAKVV